MNNKEMASILEGIHKRSIDNKLLTIGNIVYLERVIKELGGKLYMENKKVNKFEVGDEVIYNYYENIYEKVRYCGKNSEEKPIIEYDNNFITVVEGGYDRLFSIKKKDELTVGDKFIDIDGLKVEVLKKYEDEINGIKYVGKTYIEECSYISIWSTGMIDKVIYE